jgi:hypothetical protein
LSTAIVVCFRWGTELGSAEHGSSGQGLKAAVRAAQQAEALGALLCAFASGELAVAFASADHDEAVHFAARAIRHAAGALAGGVGCGELSPLFEAGRFVSLSWGEALECAAKLAARARAGEVLLDGELEGAKDGSVSARHVGDAIELGGRKRAVLSLDVAHPFVRESMTLYEDTFTSSSEADELQRHPTGSMHMADIAREALVRGDTQSLDFALRQLKLTGENPDLAARLAGVLALTRGAKEEGLRILRRAVEQEERDDRRARALLAYAVGLAAAARNEEALLAALQALAVTRAHGDKSGENACARFLAQLTRAAGHEEPARVWEEAASRLSRPPPP